MRATAIEVTADSAIVELRPSWIARLFGARVSVIELVRVARDTWRTKHTGRNIDYIEHGVSIRRALDFRVRAALPTATVRDRRSVGGS